MIGVNLASAVITGLAAAAPLSERASTSGVLGVPVSHKQSTAPRFTNSSRVGHPGRSSRKRSDPQSSLQFTGERYFIDYELAGQTITGILDTGSSDTWVFATGASGSNLFDPSTASGYTWLSNGYHEAYGDGSNQVSGTWADASVSVGGASVGDYQFAYLNQSDTLFPDNRGIFGIGVQVAESANPQYTPFVERLKEQGTISSNAFSLYLSNEEATEAQLLLGGVDLAKSDGQMYTIPWSSGTFGIYSSYYGVDAEVMGTQFSAIWDTGTPVLELPQSVADKVAAEYGFSWSDSSEAYLTTTEPDLTGKSGLNVSFSGVEINIPAKDLILADYDGTYEFAVSRATPDGLIQTGCMGDPILRQLNMVFDLENHQYGIAPVKFTSESNVQAITDSIPGAQPA